jgi:DNA methylase N-4/N-6 domain protein
VKVTDNEADLSQSKTLDRFLSLFLNSTENTVKYLRSGKHFAIVVGDLYRDGEIVPLAFYMMDVIKKNIKCKLKGIVVKDIVGNRRKMGTEGLWRYRTLKSDTFLFKHMYIFLFKKG